MIPIGRADVPKAEHAAWEQRRAIVGKFIKMSRKRADNPADIAMCERVIAAAKDDFGEFENLMTFPEVNVLFVRGALFFKRS